VTDVTENAVPRAASLAASPGQNRIILGVGGCSSA
jgi:hypothetical protein